MLQCVDRVGNPGIPNGQCGMDAGSVDRRPWLGPLLLVGGWLAEGQRDSGTRKHLTPKARAVGAGRSQYIFPCRLGVGVSFRDLHPCTGRDGFEVV